MSINLTSPAAHNYEASARRGCQVIEQALRGIVSGVTLDMWKEQEFLRMRVSCNAKGQVWTTTWATTDTELRYMSPVVMVVKMNDRIDELIKNIMEFEEK